MMDVADQDGDGFVGKEEFFRVLNLSKILWSYIFIIKINNLKYK